MDLLVIGASGFTAFLILLLHYLWAKEKQKAENTMNELIEMEYEILELKHENVVLNEQYNDLNRKYQLVNTKNVCLSHENASLKKQKN
jgi:hypothetical protein